MPTPTVRLYMSEHPQVEEPIGIELQDDNGTVRRYSGIVTSVGDDQFNYVVQDLKTKSEIDEIPPANMMMTQTDDWIAIWNNKIKEQ